MPAIEIAAFVSPRSMPRKLGRTAKVGMSVMPDIWKRDAVRDPALTCPLPARGERDRVGVTAAFRRTDWRQSDAFLTWHNGRTRRTLENRSLRTERSPMFARCRSRAAILVSRRPAPPVQGGRAA